MEERRREEAEKGAVHRRQDVWGAEKGWRELPWLCLPLGAAAVGRHASMRRMRGEMARGSSCSPPGRQARLHGLDTLPGLHGLHGRRVRAMVRRLRCCQLLVSDMHGMRVVPGGTVVHGLRISVLLVLCMLLLLCVGAEMSGLLLAPCLPRRP
jgi:hypothetical protein